MRSSEIRTEEGQLKEKSLWLLTNKDLLRIHSREEDRGDVEVFRPEGFAFPPAFGRDGFEMRKDGQFVQYDIGPADEVVRVLGRWTSPGPQRVSVSFEGTEREGYSFGDRRRR